MGILIFTFIQQRVLSIKQEKTLAQIASAKEIEVTDFIKMIDQTRKDKYLNDSIYNHSIKFIID